ncbi:uncharacterized protein EI97DRAFT_414568 [Westerdykella ornata]|uniref:NACHT domain-containing protein n=1 Tax=Westerdykella ornata TaxID=318751 RepID=A0A6A6JTA9_WESOR|nr:uncharacterized protein EI97DRAFT_414568 [Westerdykella ornata]KAF2278229.1 hypothetical protein EI97DRAFT_414568 [Westerdykella ornata]
MSVTVHIDSNVAEAGSTQINNVSLNTTYTVDELDRACLNALRCPNTLEVMTRLKEKDKLRYESINWIMYDPQYLRWQNDSTVSLLWIKGGAGKGKTMMTIGLIETLSRVREPPPILAYFFCQNTEYELNTIDGILKGLIMCLGKQEKELMEPLRRRWDAAKGQFKENLTSWRALWAVFLEMLDCCRSRRISVVVDALDECRDQTLAEFLRLIVRTGLAPNIKWLVTSRPLDSAEQELLSGSDQVMVSLDLNSEHVAHAVKRYIGARVYELDRRHKYGLVLRQELETKLTEKAAETFLWVSLVCKRLEEVSKANVLDVIDELPPGLTPFYRRIFAELRSGQPAVVAGCMRLLKVMLLVHRPLREEEVSSVTGWSSEEATVEDLVDRCASFVRKRGRSIEFIHQSAQDYLKEEAHSALDSYGNYGHGEIASNCLDYLFEHLQVNILGLRRPKSDCTLISDIQEEKTDSILESLDYAATFWAKHLGDAGGGMLARSLFDGHDKITVFLRTKLLEWLECLSLLGQLGHANNALIIILEGSRDGPLKRLVGDAIRFLARHYDTIELWPLQIYSSAIIFSPRRSIIKECNLDKLPRWLRNKPQVEGTWSSSAEHTGTPVWFAMDLSPDGKRIAAGGIRGAIHLWHIMTDSVQKMLAPHQAPVTSVVFSPTGTPLASGSLNGTIKLWDGMTADLQETLADHTKCITAIDFSPNGEQIASSSWDETVKLWDARTGGLQKTLSGHSDKVTAIAFSPDGKLIASCSDDQTIKLWDATRGYLQKTLIGHQREVSAIVFSPDGKELASSGADGFNVWSVKLWNVTEALKFSRFFGGTLSNFLGFQSFLEIKTPRFVRQMAYHKSGRFLMTNIGPISIEDVTRYAPSPGPSSLEELWCGDNWLWYGRTRIIRLPNQYVIGWRERGDEAAVAFSSGLILNLSIDREELARTLQGLAD